MHWRWLLLLAVLLASTHAKVYFKETFDETWEERWTKSDWHQDDGRRGKWTWTAGKWFGDRDLDKGIQTTDDAKFFAISAEFPEVFDNRDSDLVVQYSVKHEQRIDCGGGYIKVMPESSKDLMGKNFDGDTPYLIMFGPDICGGKKKVHMILWHNETNHMTLEDVKCKSDQLTHVYTLYITPENEYKVFIDLEEVKSGDLFKSWEIVKERTIKDPDAEKPEDWDERRKIPDPDDVKPEGYDDIPEYIIDKDAEQPEDWDEESDGEWEPPKIKNPDFKGKWKAKMIDNPAYKGKWIAPEIPNPEYFHDDMLYHHPAMKLVGFELWQVKSGSIFDNIFIGDDLEEALQFGRDTFGKSKAGEKAMFEEIEKEEDERRRSRMNHDDDDFNDEDDEDYDEEEDEEDDDDYTHKEEL